jgi:TPR repeat protein
MAAAQGHAVAQFNLAIRHAGGIGTPKDEAKAAEWLQRSAFQGYPAAQFNLGVMYANGIGGPKNPVRALVWYTLAARQNDPEAVTEKNALDVLLSDEQKAEAQKFLTEVLGKMPGK